MANNKKRAEGIRETSTGSGYQIRIRRKGAPDYSETIQGTSKASLARAIKRREWLIDRINAGLPIEEENLPIREAAYFGDVAQDYLLTLEAKDRVIKEYSRILNSYWMPPFSQLTIDVVTKDKIKKIIAGWGVSTKTKKNRLIVLTGVFKHAEIYPPPSLGIKLRKHQKPPVQRYLPKERTALLGKLKGDALLYFTLLFDCGLRPGEALALQRADFDGECLNICKQITDRKLDNETKTYMRRKVYVPLRARSTIQKHPVHLSSPYYLVNSIGGPVLDTDELNAQWKDAHKKTRLPYRIPYACRHTRAAELLSLGIQPADAAGQMGHDVETFFRTYAEFIEEYQGNQDLSRFEGVEAAK